jgi:hypothetical protein
MGHETYHVCYLEVLFGAHIPFEGVRGLHRIIAIRQWLQRPVGPGINRRPDWSCNADSTTSCRQRRACRACMTRSLLARWPSSRCLSETVVGRSHGTDVASRPSGTHCARAQFQPTRASTVVCEVTVQVDTRREPLAARGALSHVHCTGQRFGGVVTVQRFGSRLQRMIFTQVGGVRPRVRYDHAHLHKRAKIDL